MSLIAAVARNRLRMSPNPQEPGYKERIRLRKSRILHPTDFGQISLLQRIVGCLATARQQKHFPGLDYLE